MLRSRGFSLVELSIVLVILGLLVGGVLSGQSLIRAAELRAVSEEYGKYTAAVHSFRDKYFAIPGDMANATAFWGKDNANCAGNTGTASTPGTCNGDGNGVMQDYAMPGGVTLEEMQFWKQLALAGLIEGTYTGISGPTTNIESITGSNVPRSKLSGGGWSVYYQGNVPNGDTISYAGHYGNVFYYGKDRATIATQSPVLKPEEAWNIDTKVDDGKPGTGNIIAFFWNNACASASSNTDFASPYNLSDSNVECALQINNQF